MLYHDPESYTQQQPIFLKTIVQESERLSTLIDDTLLHEQLELGNVNWDFQHHNMISIVSNTIETVTPIAEQLNIEIIHTIHTLEPTYVWADKTHLERVFINLFMNAIKFSDPQKPSSKITIHYTVTPYEVIVEIEDNGIGIAQHNLEKIFDTFVQLQDDILTNKPKGSGLGLPIVKKIIERHKGNIQVESELRRYTNFLVTLPINIVK